MCVFASMFHMLLGKIAMYIKINIKSKFKLHLKLCLNAFAVRLCIQFLFQMCMCMTSSVAACVCVRSCVHFAFVYAKYIVNVLHLPLRNY